MSNRKKDSRGRRNYRFMIKNFINTIKLYILSATRI